MKRYKVKEIIKMLEADGWYLHTTKGDHRQFKHPTKKAGLRSIKNYPTPSNKRF